MTFGKWGTGCAYPVRNLGPNFVFRAFLFVFCADANSRIGNTLVRNELIVSAQVNNITSGLFHIQDSGQWLSKLEVGTSTATV